MFSSSKTGTKACLFFSCLLHSKENILLTTTLHSILYSLCPGMLLLCHLLELTEVVKRDKGIRAELKYKTTNNRLKCCQLQLTENCLKQLLSSLEYSGKFMPQKHSCGSELKAIAACIRIFKNYGECVLVYYYLMKAWTKCIIYLHMINRLQFHQLEFDIFACVK